MEVGSRNAHLDGAMRQNTGSARPARQDRRVKPDGVVMQGPKRPRRYRRTRIDRGFAKPFQQETQSQTQCDPRRMPRLRHWTIAHNVGCGA
jgi:hypothetical protein